MTTTVLRRATIDDAEDIYKLVQKTILTIYPHYYPSGVVDFFSDLHCLENISRDLVNSEVHMLVLEKDGWIFGTGSCQGNHITRVFVDPNIQRRGYGSLIMQKLEGKVAVCHEYAEVDSSLSASLMYEKRGYHTVKHEVIDTESGAVLVYEVMRKLLKQ